MPETPKTPKTQSLVRALFEKLPEKVRVWLTSEEATFIIIDLNRRLGLDGILIEIIPDAITRLVIGKLKPENFTEEVASDLEINLSLAQGITQEIERRILRPVEKELLLEAGIDVKMLFMSKPSPIIAPSRPPVQPTQMATSAKPATPSSTNGSPFVYTPNQTPPIPPKPIIPPIQPMPPTPQAPRDIPVKINVQPIRQAQGEQPAGDPTRPSPRFGEAGGNTNQPFGADSWVNKVK